MAQPPRACFAPGVRLAGARRACARRVCGAAGLRADAGGDGGAVRAREARRAASAARVAAARASVRRAGDARVYVGVPREHRERAALTARLARVKVFVPAGALRQEEALRAVLVERLVGRFPELRGRGLVEGGGDVGIAVGGVRIGEGDDEGLGEALRRFEKGDGVDDVFAEVLMRRLPDPPPRPSARRLEVRGRAAGDVGRLRMVSFYVFREMESVEMKADRLGKIWRELGVLGRVYVAREGVNAQLAVPVAVWPDFVDLMSGAWREKDMPDALVGVFLNVDADVERAAAPFEKLHVRPREKVLSDGLDAPLDWARAGREVPPAEWHETLRRMNDDYEGARGEGGEGGEGADPKPIVLDCRNRYESDVGRFDGAEPLDTDNFRETWRALETRLDGVPKDAPILTFCTGGIRCNKVNAYLSQKMGFENTGRLAGGIVSYARELRDAGRLDESQFKGVNHVFDGRLGAAVTDDLLDHCINCGAPCNTQTDCANVACPRPFHTRLFVQCPACASRLGGACCPTCQTAARARDASTTATTTTAAASSGLRDTASRPYDGEYSAAMSSTEPALLAELRRETTRRFPGGAHMLSGAREGALYAMLARLCDARRVLEVGTFTGYATLWLARGVPAGGRVVTCELDDAAADLAAGFFARDEHGGKVELVRGRALDAVRAAESRGETFDVVFLDADKRYGEYYDALMGGVLRVGGLLIVDNVLFRGEVAAQARKGEGERQGEDGVIGRRRLKSVEKVRDIAARIHAFNAAVAADARAEQVMLPVRDGISLVRRVA